MPRTALFLVVLGTATLWSSPGALGTSSASVAVQTPRPFESDLNAVAALPGEPRVVSAAGVTRDETPLLTIENPAAFDPSETKLRVVIMGGLDGDEPAKAIIAEQDAEIAEKSGQPRGPIKSIRRAGEPEPRSLQKSERVAQR